MEDLQVGDRDAVRVPAEIPEHLLGVPERGFGIDHPLMDVQSANPGPEMLRLCRVFRD